MTSLRNLLFASAIAAGALVATSASATEIFINKVGYYSTQKVKITKGLSSHDDIATGLVLDVNYGVGPSLPVYTLWGFCVDLFHEIDAGNGYQKPVNLQYHSGAVDNDSNGHALTVAQTSQIYGLANLGYQLVQSAASDLQNKLSGIQAAIWQIEYGTDGYSITPYDAGVQAYMASYITLAPSLNGAGAFGLYADDFKTQGFVIGVPEPATWAMMIVGFGLVGVTLRSSRRRPVAA